MPEALQPPREMNKVSLPAYRIEPPDVIQIEMLKLIPLPPYRAEIFDVLQIRDTRLIIFKSAGSCVSAATSVAPLSK